MVELTVVVLSSGWINRQMFSEESKSLHTLWKIDLLGLSPIQTNTHDGVIPLDGSSKLSKLGEKSSFLCRDCLNSPPLLYFMF